MLQSQSPFRTRAKNLSNSPSSRLGRLFPPFGRNSVMPLLGGNLLLRPVELGSIDPHAMQNDRELARDRNLGLAEPVALGELHSPSLHSGPDRHSAASLRLGRAAMRVARCVKARHGRTAFFAVSNASRFQISTINDQSNFTEKRIDLPNSD